MTLRTRRVAIRRFIAWADARGIAEPAQITPGLLERYQRALFAYRKPDGTPLALGTQFSCLLPLRSWFGGLARAGEIPVNPAAELVLPRLSKQLPRALLGLAEVEAVLAAADPATPEGLRDRAMLELLYSTGLRRAELARLRRYDADLVLSRRNLAPTPPRTGHSPRISKIRRVGTRFAELEHPGRRPPG